MTDWNARLDAALLRIVKRIEARAQVELGRKPSTANRSVGQLFAKRNPRAHRRIAA